MGAGKKKGKGKDAARHAGPTPAREPDAAPAASDAVPNDDPYPDDPGFGTEAERADAQATREATHAYEISRAAYAAALAEGKEPTRAPAVIGFAMSCLPPLPPRPWPTIGDEARDSLPPIVASVEAAAERLYRAAIAALPEAPGDDADPNQRTQYFDAVERWKNQVLFRAGLGGITFAGGLIPPEYLETSVGEDGVTKTSLKRPLPPEHDPDCGLMILLRHRPRNEDPNELTRLLILDCLKPPFWETADPDSPASFAWRRMTAAERAVEEARHRRERDETLARWTRSYAHLDGLDLFGPVPPGLDPDHDRAGGWHACLMMISHAWDAGRFGVLGGEQPLPWPVARSLACEAVLGLHTLALRLVAWTRARVQEIKDATIPRVEVIGDALRRDRFKVTQAGATKEVTLTSDLARMLRDLLGPDGDYTGTAWSTRTGKQRLIAALPELARFVKAVENPPDRKTHKTTESCYRLAATMHRPRAS